MPSPATATVFVLDQDPDARASTIALATSLGLSVEAFATVEDFLLRVDPWAPGCVVTDLDMPGLGGLELQQLLARTAVPLSVVVLTAHADIPTTVKVLHLGAVTLLEKPCTTAALEEAIRSAIEQNAVELRRAVERQTVQQRLESLTADERQVLDLIVAGHQNKAIAEQLGRGLRTIESRRQAVFHKMGTDNLATLVRMIAENASPADA
jgi:FixJ family two-component response regulator